jgi:hypothetical protein
MFERNYVTHTPLFPERISFPVGSPKISPGVTFINPTHYIYVIIQGTTQACKTRQYFHVRNKRKHMFSPFSNSPPPLPMVLEKEDWH